ARLQATQQRQLGTIGVVLTPLHPGGKARFGDEILDVVSQGDPIESGRTVRVIGHRGFEAIVETA
ncbi:MAG: NfeD-like C-terminal, partner-binding, partial [Verrucomicrobiota bacterium]